MYKTNKFIANTYTKSTHKHHAPSNQCFLEKMTASDSFYNGCDERSSSQRGDNQQLLLQVLLVLAFLL